MPRKLASIDADGVQRIDRAINDLRMVRDELKGQGCTEAAKAVTRAIKSAEGASRHAWRRFRATKQT